MNFFHPLMFASVDIGNDSVKGIYGINKRKLVIPNVIYQEPDRDVVEYENKPSQGLHVEIESSSLSRKKGVYAVGELAMRYRGNDQPSPNSHKHENDQTIILLLTYLAHETCSHLKNKGKYIKVNYIIATGLPIADRNNRKLFKEKLKKEKHTVKFLKTPHFEGITVEIIFQEVLVAVEGFVAYSSLISNLNYKNDIENKTILLNDIGGVSTDSAIINENQVIDNKNSIGIPEGTALYLDEIIRLVQHQYRYSIKSRAELVKILTDKHDCNMIYVKSSKKSIQDIVDPVLKKLAKIEYQHISDLWELVPNIRIAMMLGGGSLLLKNHITQINQEKYQFSFKFLSEEESIWAIVNAYYDIMIAWCKKNGIKLVA